ncbi:MAG: PD40 domain-containing protein [Nitrospirae bacterium]|nr:PD40 domain-containing protein [Nitrospirota bacterium]
MNNKVSATTTLLATIAANEETGSAEDPLARHATSEAEKKTAEMLIEMNQYGKGVAYISQHGNLVGVVHNGKRGKLYKELEPSSLTLSPDGQRVAYSAKVEDKWFVVVDGKEHGPFDDKGPPVFSPDSRHIAYEGQIGSTWHMFIDDKKGPGVPVSFQDKATFSGDSSRLLAVENVAGGIALNVTDLSFNRLGARKVRGVPVAVNPEKTRIAAVDIINNKQRVIEFSFSRPDIVKEGPLYDGVDNLAFNNDGTALTYMAGKGTDFYIVLNGKEELLPKGQFAPLLPVIRPDKKGVGLFIHGRDGAYLHQAFYNDGTAKNLYKEGADLTYSKDGSRHAYVAIKNERFLIVVNGKEGPVFDRVTLPKFSPDGKYLVYRARQKNKRFVVVADADGTILRQHPGYERVFETVFTPDGKSVGYGVKDGRKLIWKAEKLGE